METLRVFLAPWYLELKFVHLLAVMAWIWSTSVAYLHYLVPVFYAGMVLIEYAWRNETRILSWKLIAAACASALLLSRLSYQWLMSLDAQRGRGSRWQLPRSHGQVAAAQKPRVKAANSLRPGCCVTA